MLKKLLLTLWVVLFICELHAQDQRTKIIDATKIASEYYNSIVKILLVDSIAEKRHPGSGYLGRGSGFIVTENGYVFTNKHVIDFCLGLMGYTYFDPEDAKIKSDKDTYSPKVIDDPSYTSIKYIRRAIPIVQVYTSPTGDYKLYRAKVVAADTLNIDGAILKITSEFDGSPVTATFHPTPLANSDSTRQGEDLCVYGFPAQFDGNFDAMLKDQSTLTFGKNSGEDNVFNTQYGMIKTDASINGGNSGGPVFNSNNKVIGLASKTIDKTQTGLIGGINGMYNLVALIPDLQQVMKDRGLTPPQKQVSGNTALLNTNPLLLSPKQIAFVNATKRLQRKFKGGFFYIKAATAVSQSNKYSIESTSPNNTNLSVTASGNVVVTNKTYNQIDLGYVFTLWRITPKQKLSLDWNILSAGQGTFDWSKSTVFKDSALASSSLQTPNTAATYYRFGTRLGLYYSQIIAKQFIGSIYYKCGAIEEFVPGTVSTALDNVVTTSGPSISGSTPHGPVAFTTLANSINQPLLQNTIGCDFRWRFLLVGCEYSFGQYAIAYQYNSTTFASGQHLEQTLSLHIGVAFNNSNKWKDLLINAYDRARQ